MDVLHPGAGGSRRGPGRGPRSQGPKTPPSRRRARRGRPGGLERARPARRPRRNALSTHLPGNAARTGLLGRLDRARPTQARPTPHVEGGGRVDGPGMRRHEPEMPPEPPCRRHVNLCWLQHGLKFVVVLARFTWAGPGLVGPRTLRPLAAGLPQEASGPATSRRPVRLGAIPDIAPTAPPTHSPRSHSDPQSPLFWGLAPALGRRCLRNRGRPPDQPHGRRSPGAGSQSRGQSVPSALHTCVCPDHFPPLPPRCGQCSPAGPLCRSLRPLTDIRQAQWPLITSGGRRRSASRRGGWLGAVRVRGIQSWSCSGMPPTPRPGVGSSTDMHGAVAGNAYNYTLVDTRIHARSPKGAGAEGWPDPCFCFPWSPAGAPVART